MGQCAACPFSLQYVLRQNATIANKVMVVYQERIDKITFEVNELSKQFTNKDMAIRDFLASIGTAYTPADKTRLAALVQDRRRLQQQLALKQQQLVAVQTKRDNASVYASVQQDIAAEERVRQHLKTLNPGDSESATEILDDVIDQHQLMAENSESVHLATATVSQVLTGPTVHAMTTTSDLDAEVESLLNAAVVSRTPRAGFHEESIDTPIEVLPTLRGSSKPVSVNVIETPDEQLQTLIA